MNGRDYDYGRNKIGSHICITIRIFCIPIAFNLIREEKENYLVYKLYTIKIVATKYFDGKLVNQ